MDEEQVHFCFYKYKYYYNIIIKRQNKIFKTSTLFPLIEEVILRPNLAFHQEKNNTNHHQKRQY